MICTEIDEWMASKIEGTTIFQVELSDGTIVYDDTDRPDVVPENAWLRLHQYCLENNLYVKSLLLKFRSHVVTIFDENTENDGAYLIRSVLGQFGNPKTQQFYVAGYARDGIVYCTKFKSPELLEWEKDERTVRDDDLCLIRKI